MPTYGVEAPDRARSSAGQSIGLRGQHSSADARFWSKVVAQANGCWDWTGAMTSAGYGSFGAVTYPKVRMISSHKWVWERSRGPVPEGMVLMHSCDNRRCVNLAHLSLGTVSDNNRDMCRKGRHRSGTPHCRLCRGVGHNARTCEVVS